MTLTKKCNKCGVEKELSAFSKRKRAKDGFQSWCKQCYAIAHSEWYKDNKNEVDYKNREWARNNIERAKARQRKYYEENKQRISETAHARYVAKHGMRIKKTEEERKELREKYLKKYFAENKSKINAKKMERLNNDPIFARAERLRLALREGVNTARNGGRSNKKSLLKQVTTLYSAQLWEYLCKTWENRYGKKWSGEPYHIDHILPLCTAKTIEDIDRLFHYSNLQMLTPEDNIKKKEKDIKLKNAEALRHFSY